MVGTEGLEPSTDSRGISSALSPTELCPQIGTGERTRTSRTMGLNHVPMPIRLHPQIKTRRQVLVMDSNHLKIFYKQNSINLNDELLFSNVFLLKINQDGARGGTRTRTTSQSRDFRTTLCHHSHISVLQSGLCLHHIYYYRFRWLVYSLYAQSFSTIFTPI